MNEFQSKNIIIIILLILCFSVGLFFIAPTISDKSKTASSKLAQAEVKSKQLEDRQDSLKLKIAAQKNKQLEVDEKELQKNEKMEELGLNTNNKFLDSSNKNIFFLFSRLSDTLQTNIAELSIQDVDVFTESNEISIENEDTIPTNEDVATPTDIPIENEPTEEVVEIVTPYVVKNEKQVSISMYGAYLDIMLYFQMLDKLSDNFELVSLDIAPLVLANGYPIDDYQLMPNDYGFISGKTVNNATKVDIFYYEDKIKENLKLAKEKSEKIEEEKLQKKQENIDKSTELANKYTVSKEEVIQMARYYGNKFGVPVPYILAVIDIQSSFDSSKTSINENGTKDRGLMQLNEITSQELITKILKLEYISGMEYIPALNMELGVTYLKSIANSRGIDLNNPKPEDLHILFTSYNRGQSGADKYSATNKSYDITPYESSYSKSVIVKTQSSEYVTYADDTPIETYEYLKDFEDLKLSTLENEKNENESSDIEEIYEIKDYVEVTSVKAVFRIITEGDNTLLLDDINFDFNSKNTKDSPMSFGNLSEVDTSNVEDNILNKKLSDDKYRKEELENTKTIIRNRVANGLSINAQLDYLKLITLNNM